MAQTGSKHNKAATNKYNAAYAYFIQVWSTSSLPSPHFPALPSLCFSRLSAPSPLYSLSPLWYRTSANCTRSVCRGGRFGPSSSACLFKQRAHPDLSPSFQLGSHATFPGSTSMLQPIPRGVRVGWGVGGRTSAFYPQARKGKARQGKQSCLLSSVLLAYATELLTVTGQVESRSNCVEDSSPYVTVKTIIGVHESGLL